METPPLPSPVFLALVPNADNPLSLARLDDIAQCLESGHWKLDPHEVDPRTGDNLVLAITGEYVQDDEVRKKALSLAVRFGVDVNAPDLNGFTAWQRARAQDDREIEQHLEELGARLPPGMLNAAQQEITQDLQSLSRSLMVGRRLIERITGGKIFDSLDAHANGIPLGLHMLWGHMSVNGAHIANGDNDQETARLSDHAISALSSMGKAALDVEPSSQFPLWCWLAQAQAVYWAGENVSDSRRRKWEGSWRSLERKILRHLSPGKGSAQAQADLAERVIGMVEGAMHLVAQMKADQDKKMLQPLAATLLTGLSSWKQRLDEVTVKDMDIRRQATWQAAARLAQAVPMDRWGKEFSDAWSSPLAYALSDGEIRKAIHGEGPLPESLPSPWLTVMPLIAIEYRFAQKGEERNRLVQWAASLPATPQERDLGMAMLAHAPWFQADLKGCMLDATLPSAAPSRPFRF